jgi:hypothetical protein
VFDFLTKSRLHRIDWLDFCARTDSRFRLGLSSVKIRSEPHRVWWKNFLRDSGGTGFWHETYLMQGGVEAICDDVPGAFGFMRFAQTQAARGTMFGAAHRMSQADGGDTVVSEQELYGP